MSFCIRWIYLFLLLTVICPQADAVNAANGYPLPVAETEKVIADWFDSQKFEVVRSELEMGIVQLTAKKSGEIYRIRLTPDSPLATDVTVIEAGQHKKSSIPKRLQHRLGGYVSMTAPQRRNSPQAVPPKILSERKAAVCIHAVTGKKEIQLTGFTVDREGLIICTAHNLKKIQRISVSFGDGNQRNARILKIDRKRDLILLYVRLNFRHFIPLEKSRNDIHAGEKLFAVGCSVNGDHPVQPGAAGPLRKSDGQPLRQVNMKIRSGSSGSPVLDAEGRLAGVVKGRFRGNHSVGFLIPAETVIDFLKDRHTGKTGGKKP